MKTLPGDEIVGDAKTPIDRVARRLAYLYGDEKAEDLRRRVSRIVETHRQLRKRLVDRHYWDQADVVLITYGDSIQEPGRRPLQTLHDFLTQHLADAFSMVHVLPFFPWSSDDGFSVTDFRSVDETLGTWGDVLTLEEDFDLVIDLVLNHCSRENLWFIDFIAGELPAADYFIDMNPGENLSMVTRPRSTPLLSGVRTQRGLRHVWATFSNDQIDMNYANPAVLLEFIDIFLYYFRRGARMIRLDAVAYLWKEVGTSCIHLPQTHQVIKLLRDVASLVEPGGLIMTETNVPHEENISYFGNGDEAQVIYQFSLPPLLLHALHSGSTKYLVAWAKEVEQETIPDGCTFLNFTASHDGVGMRPLEGLVPAGEVKHLLEAMHARGGFVSYKSNSDGTESPYELNISLFDAFRDINDPQDNRWQVPAFFVSQLVALSMKGIPAVYIHCLTATPNDLHGVERTGMTRSINRRKWDRGELEKLIDGSYGATVQVFRPYSELLKLRRQQPAFHPDATQKILSLPESVFGLQRTALDGSQDIVALFNFTDQVQQIDCQDLLDDISERRELIGRFDVDRKDGMLQLPPYATFWFARAGRQ